mmetsp:Transcript_103646/g.302496  ORF Transcript_103646/g.302496 Transcript_103646/m.302496 type:complete len:231 (-) Transcript_103646:558-1250(-)
MYSADHEQRRDGELLRGLALGPVGEDDELRTIADSVRGLVAEVRDCLFQGIRALLEGVARGDLHREEAAALDRGQLVLVEEGRLEAQEAVVHHGVLEEGGALRHKVALAAKVEAHGHDQGLTIGVNGRICDLGKALREVVVEYVRPFREHGQGLVVAHAEGGLLSRLRHGLHHQLNIFNGVASIELQLDKVVLHGPRRLHAVPRLQERLRRHGLAEDLVPSNVLFLLRHL